MDINHERRITMPYKPFEPKDSLEAVMSKLWGDPREVNPKTRLEEIILKIANAQPTGIHAVPDIEEADVGKVLTAGEDGAVWSSGGGGGGVFVCTSTAIPDDPDDNEILNKTWAEINNAASSGIPVFIISNYADEQVIVMANYVSNTESAPYSVSGYIGEGTFVWSASSENDYPQTDYGG